MTYYLNPYMIIVKRRNSCYYQFDNTLYHLTLREYEILKSSSDIKKLVSPERLDVFIKTKLLLDQDYEVFSQEIEYVNRGWFEMGDFKKEDFFKISQSSILILGCGGTGTHVAWNLAALGIRRFILIDDDIVELSNLNRQLLYDINDVGCYKVDALEKKLRERFPSVEISTFKVRVYDGLDISNLVDFKNIDVVVKGIDTPLDNLYRLGEYFYENRIKYVSGGTVGTNVFLGPTYAPSLSNQFRKTQEYISNSEMELTKRVSGKAVSIPVLFSYIGSELAKEIIFLLTNNETKVRYNDKIVIKDIFADEKVRQNKMYLLTRFISSFVVILSVIGGDGTIIVVSTLLLLLCQTFMEMSAKDNFIDYLCIALSLGIIGLFRQEIVLANSLQAIAASTFALLSYICYISIALMLLKFTVTILLEKIKILKG